MTWTRSLPVAVRGLIFTGNRRSELEEVEIGEPGPGQALIGIRASGLCGSDLHAYRLPGGPPAYAQGRHIVAGHEPCGVVEAIGPGVPGLGRGDRVLAYHIVGCGSCPPCRSGHMVNCTSPLRDAYGAGRHGGHAPLMLAEARTLIPLPDELSFIDGAMTACGIATAYSACRRVSVSGRDTVLVVGLGPVGMGAALLAGALGARVLAFDLNRERCQLAMELGLAETWSSPEEASSWIAEATGGGGCEVAIDCSGADPGRLLCLRSAAVWGRVVLVGFGGSDLHLDAGELIITKQLTLRGSWVSSLGEMEDAARFLASRRLHADRLVTHRFHVDEGPRAYTEFDEGAPGKFVLVW
jgi:threonine dehydrogenase-like Zn-dependent dehydrogenase